MTDEISKEIVVSPNTEAAPAQPISDLPKVLPTAKKYNDAFQLHDAIQDGASLEDINVLLNSHSSPLDCIFSLYKAL